MDGLLDCLPYSIGSLALQLLILRHPEQGERVVVIQIEVTWKSLDALCISSHRLIETIHSGKCHCQAEGSLLIISLQPHRGLEHSSGFFLLSEVRENRSLLN